jgi:hypothetical protein
MEMGGGWRGGGASLIFKSSPVKQNYTNDTKSIQITAKLHNETQAFFTGI